MISKCEVSVGAMRTATASMEEKMLDDHAEMHKCYEAANIIELPPTITDEDFAKGRVGEVINWCRNKLGGRDENLVRAEQWAKASREGWSPKVTYRCLPSTMSGKSWGSYIHDAGHFVLDLRYPNGHESHTVEHASLELELRQLVHSWFVSKTPREFAMLTLSRPPDLRQSK